MLRIVSISGLLVLAGCDQPCTFESRQVDLDESVRGVSAGQLVDQLGDGHDAPLRWLDPPQRVVGNPAFEVGTTVAGSVSHIAIVPEPDRAWALVHEAQEKGCGPPTVRALIPTVVTTDDGVLDEQALVAVGPAWFEAGAPRLLLARSTIPAALGLTVSPDAGTAPTLFVEPTDPQMIHGRITVTLRREADFASVALATW